MSIERTATVSPAWPNRSGGRASGRPVMGRQGRGQIEHGRVASRALAGDEGLMRSTFAVACNSVLPAWRWSSAHTDGKPVVLIGDSEGSAVLIHLVSHGISDYPDSNQITGQGDLNPANPGSGQRPRPASPSTQQGPARAP
jgi:Protein of unknown function (DUF3089)